MTAGDWMRLGEPLNHIWYMIGTQIPTYYGNMPILVILDDVQKTRDSVLELDRRLAEFAEKAKREYEEAKEDGKRKLFD